MDCPADDPDLKALIETVDQVMNTALTALDKGYSLPALILAYSLIDTFGWLSSTGKETVADRFMRFARDWVMVDGEWGCTPQDLYAARCATLHRMTGDSELSEKGPAKRLLYVYGTSDTGIADDAVDEGVSEAFGRISVNRLVGAAGMAAAKYALHAYNDENHRDTFLARARRYYTSVECSHPKESGASGTD